MKLHWEGFGVCKDLLSLLCNPSFLTKEVFITGLDSVRMCWALPHHWKWNSRLGVEGASCERWKCLCPDGRDQPALT